MNLQLCLTAVLVIFTTSSDAALPVDVKVYYEALCGDSIRFIKGPLNDAYEKVRSIMNLTLVPFGKATVTSYGAARVNVTVYYESLCPDSIRFIKGPLAQAYSKVPSLMDLTMIPYGFAKETPDGSGGYTYKCQHGHYECQGNRIHNCAIHLMPDITKYFPYIECIASNQFIPEAISKVCAQQQNVSWNDISSCEQGATARTLIHEMAQKTAVLSGGLHYVPRIDINGVHMKQAEYNLILKVCENYKGTLPQACIDAGVVVG